MPKYNNPRKTWFYSNEFKIKAVKLSYQPDIQSKQVADGLGIHPLMLSRWRKEYREGKIQGDGKKRVGVSNKRKSPPKKSLLKMQDLKKKLSV